MKDEDLLPEFIKETIPFIPFKEAEERVKQGLEIPIAFRTDTTIPHIEDTKREYGVILTKVCNMNCPFCIWANYPKDISFINLTDFEKIVLKMKDERYTLCSLIGGEVGLHPKFKEIINILVKNEVKFTLVTNCKNWEMYKFLVEDKKINKYFNSLAVSLDGTEPVHDRFRGQGSYKKVLEALEYFTSKKKSPSIKMVLRIDNHQDIGHVLDIAEKYRVDFEAFDNSVSPQFYLTAGAHKFLNEFFEKEGKNIRKRFNKIKRRYSAYYKMSYDNWSYICPKFFDRAFIIHPNGNAVICCGGLVQEGVIGNIFNNSVKEILRNKVIVSLEILRKVWLPFQLEIPMAGIDNCAYCRKCWGCKK